MKINRYPRSSWLLGAALILATTGTHAQFTSTHSVAHGTSSKTPDQLRPLESSPDRGRHDTAKPEIQWDHPWISASAPTAKDCATANQLAQLTGTGLTSRLRSLEATCLNSLFSVSAPLAQQLFNEEQMLSVIRELEQLAADYPGNNRDGILSLVMYLRAGFYVQFYQDGAIADYSSAVDRAMTRVLDRFFNGPHAWDVSDSHGAVLQEMVTLIDSADQNLRYLWVADQLITRFDQDYLQHRSMTAAANSAFTVLFRAHQHNGLEAALNADDGVVHSLIQFTRTHTALLGTDNEYIILNAGRELARFLDYDQTRAPVRQRLQQILNQYDMAGHGSALWVTIASQVDYYDSANCDLYNVCNFEEELQATILPLTHACSNSLVIRAQDMTQSQFDASCASMARQEEYFHQRLATSRHPVSDDFNDTLEVVVFGGSQEYQSYAGALFGITTDNGGMYLEGDPSNPENQARFIAYEAEWLRPDFEIWNLNHEYVHYLDGRYNLWGDFQASTSGPTVWWIEGLAEYLSLRDNNPRAIELARTQSYDLSTLFQNDYNSGTERIYQWGYLAVRYMFERHPQDVSNILDFFRVGEYGHYTDYMRQIGRQYDADFRDWLLTVSSGDDGTDGGSDGGTDDTGEGTPPSSGCEAANPDDYRDLSLGSTLCDVETLGGNYFFVYVDEAEDNLRITLNNAGDDTSLTVSHNSWPTEKQGDYRGTGTGPTRVIDIPDPQPDSYYMIHVGFATASNLNLSAELQDTGEATESEQELHNGQPESLKLNGSAYRYVYVPEGSQWLYLTAIGGGAQTELYVNKEGWPTAAQHDQGSQRQGSVQSLLVSPVEGGRYYHIMVATDREDQVELKAQFE